MSCGKDELTERLLKCLDELEECRSDLENHKDSWINSLKELSEIEDAFEVDENNKLHGKTILDVGTDCVKPLYIALKYEPSKIIGINEYPCSFASDVEHESKYFIHASTEIHFHDCSFFDEQQLKVLGIDKSEDNEVPEEDKKDDKFDYILLSKTLHHLRTGECVAKERNKEHDHIKNEKCCINRFETEKIFERLLKLGTRVIVYEYFDPTEEDDDKVRGRGGFFTSEEWNQIFERLISEKYKVRFIKPIRCHLNKKEQERVSAKLKEVDLICFYVEK